MLRGWHLDSGILVRLVTNLAVYKIRIMAILLQGVAVSMKRSLYETSL